MPKWRWWFIFLWFFLWVTNYLRVYHNRYIYRERESSPNRWKSKVLLIQSMVIYLSIYFGMTIYIYIYVWYERLISIRKTLQSRGIWVAGKLLASCWQASKVDPIPLKFVCVFLPRALDAWPFLNNDHMMSTLLLTDFFRASFSWYLQMRCSGTQGRLWIAQLKDHMKQAAIDFVLVVHSELEHSYLSNRHAGCPCVLFSTLRNGFFLPEKEAEFYSPRNAVLLHDILWRLLPT